MGGLGIDARDKLEVAANATVTVGGSGTGNVHLGGNMQLSGTSGPLIQTTGTLTSTDLEVLRASAGKGANDTHGFSITYMGSRSGNENSFSLFMDNQTSTDVEAITVFQDGKVGINNTSPSAVLDVGGDVEATGTVDVTGNVDVGANIGVGGNAVIGTYMSIANTNPAATDALVVGGNVRIASGSLIFADGTSQSSGSTTATFPTGDYGLLDAANVSTDAFGQTTGGLTTFDMLTSPTGSVDGQDLGALS